MFDIPVIIQSILIFILLFTALLLVVLPQGKKGQNIPFCIFLVLISIHIFIDLTYDTPVFNSYRIHLIPAIFIFLYAPLLYIHAKKMLGDPPQQYWPHFLLFGIFTAVYAIWGFQQQLFFPIYGLQYLAYVILITRKLEGYKLLESYRTRVFWIRFIFYYFGAIWLFAFVAITFGVLGYGPLSDGLEIASYVITITYVFGLLYLTISYLGLFRNIKISVYRNNGHQLDQLIAGGQQKYLHSRLKYEDIDSLKFRIQDYLEEEKPFLDPEFRLSQMAKALEVNGNDLSQAINEGFQKNFHALINTYRVEEVKRQLRDPRSEHLTLLAIGLQAGFNSKTTFNTVFKKITSMTPSQFKKSIVKGSKTY